MKILAISVSLVVGLILVIFWKNENPIVFRKSETNLAEAMGSFCQTQFGVCPILDANGDPIYLPLGAKCSCEQDPGVVRQ